MPAFEPFPGVRFDPDRNDPAVVSAPPYDVIDPAQRRVLAQHEHNIVHVDLPVGDDPYTSAAATLADWERAGMLVNDEPSLYVYALSAPRADGSSHTTTGVLGAMALSAPEAGEILPHERTTPKARSDRADLLAATRTNLSPIWALSPTAGLTALLDPPGDALCDFTDPDGVRHQLWRLTDPDQIEAIAKAVGGAPVVVADGHHRLETSLAYRDECHRGNTGAGGHDDIFVWVVELAADQLDVRPIHRLITTDDPAGVGPDDVQSVFDAETVAELPADVEAFAVSAGGPVLVTPTGAWVLHVNNHGAAVHGDLDTARLAGAISERDDVELTYLHDVAGCLGAVHAGKAAATVIMRPATVDQILEIAHGGERMAPKTTFFTPKPRTGLVWRRLDN